MGLGLGNAGMNVTGPLYYCIIIVLASWADSRVVDPNPSCATNLLAVTRILLAHSVRKGHRSAASEVLLCVVAL